MWEAATHPDRLEQPGASGDEDLLATAVLAVDRAKSTWTRYDLARELTRRITLDPSHPDTALANVDRLVAQALQPGNAYGVVSLAAPAVFASPPSLRRASDNNSVYAEHGAARYSTDAGLAIERRLIASARDTTGPRLRPSGHRGGHHRSGPGPRPATAVAAVLGSGRRLDVLVGPAATGKTTTMGSLARAWAGAGHQVLGVSFAENATRVLAAQAGVHGVNAAKLIFEHTQRPPEQRRQDWWRRSAVPIWPTPPRLPGLACPRRTATPPRIRRIDPAAALAAAAAQAPLDDAVDVRSSAFV
ncbi:MAG: AAA family ATPase [Acidimicrobiales bacterium]